MPDKKLEPLLFRLSPDESVNAITNYLGARLPDEYRAVGVRIRLDATADGLDVLFAPKAKKVPWKFWRAG